jgi:hypothetical protein
MHANKSAVERAFELAQSGRFATTQGIRVRLRCEGYSEQQVIGPILLKQLRALISEAKARE